MLEIAFIQKVQFSYFILVVNPGFGLKHNSQEVDALFLRSVYGLRIITGAIVSTII